MYYLYILYSATSNLYYVGYSSDPQRRIKEHNNSDHNTFTSKHRPWVLKAVFRCPSKTIAINTERFVKRQKSRVLLEKLCDPAFEPKGKLSQLVRVPKLRD